MPRPLFTLVPLVLATALTSGCTAVIATSRMVAADKAIEQAREAQADVHATFEFELALREYERSINHASWSQYRDAVETADSSKGHAEAAYAIAVGDGLERADLENAGEDLQDGGNPSTPEALQPEPTSPQPMASNEEEAEPSAPVEKDEYDEAFSDEDVEEDELWEEEE